MPTHLIATVNTEILGRWKRLTLKYACDGRPTFAYGSDDDRQFKDHAKDGATLWILTTHRDYPPTLAARLTNIQRISEQDRSGVPLGLLRELKLPTREAPYTYRVKGGRGSCFFGHNDARKALNPIALLGNRGTLVKSPKEKWQPKKHGNTIQRAHRIVDAAPLTELAASLRDQTVFVSWKHLDTRGKKREHIARRKKVRQFVRSLNKNEFAVWLDELALPNYRPKTDDDGLLELLLRQGLEKSRAVIAVATDHYAEQSEGSEENWTKKEWQSKRKCNRAVLVVDNARLRAVRERTSFQLDPAVPRLTGTAPQAARQLLEALR